MNLQNEIKNFQMGTKIKNPPQPIDTALVAWAIDKGYSDAKRTFKGIGKFSVQKTNAFANLNKNLFSFFAANSSITWGSYMKKHEDWCEQFINDLKPFKASYGQAQKVINMAMKYIFCATTQQHSAFDVCHMALDSYILAWYNRQKIGKNINKTWSSLTKKDYTEIQNNIYRFLQKGENVRKYYKREFGKKKVSNDYIVLDSAPIKAEFIIWSCERNYSDLKSTYETISKIKGKILDTSMLVKTDEADLLNLIK